MTAELPPVKCARCGEACETLTQAAAGVYRWTCGGVDCSGFDRELERLEQQINQLRKERDDLAALVNEQAALAGLVELLEPGQSVIVGRPDEAQLLELQRLEVDGAWAVTAISGEAVQLFCENDRAAALLRASEYFEQLRIKSEPAA